MSYLSASAVVIHYEEALHQVYAPLPFTFILQWQAAKWQTIGSGQQSPSPHIKHLFHDNNSRILKRHFRHIKPGGLLLYKQGLKWDRVARVGDPAPFDLPGRCRVSCLLSCSSISHKIPPRMHQNSPFSDQK